MFGGVFLFKFWAYLIDLGSCIYLNMIFGFDKSSEQCNMNSLLVVFYIYTWRTSMAAAQDSIANLYLMSNE